MGFDLSAIQSCLIKVILQNNCKIIEIRTFLKNWDPPWIHKVPKINWDFFENFPNFSFFFYDGSTKSCCHTWLFLGFSAKGRLQKKNGKKDDIMHISNYPLPPCLIVTTEIVTNHNNQWPPPSLRKEWQIHILLRFHSPSFLMI